MNKDTQSTQNQEPELTSLGRKRLALQVQLRGQMEVLISQYLDEMIDAEDEEVIMTTSDAARWDDFLVYVSCAR